MHTAHRLAAAAAAAAAWIVLAAPVAPAAADVGSTWQVARGDVRVLCPLTVGGSFEAKTSALGGTLTLTAPQPAAFSGQLSVDLRSLDTGIALRNEHMQNSYLEVGKGSGFEQAVLSDIRLGSDAAAAKGKTSFSGQLTLHGTTRPVKGQAELRPDGDSVRIDAAFPVTLAEFGIPKPQYLGVGVRDQVQVKVALVASPATNSGSAR